MNPSYPRSATDDAMIVSTAISTNLTILLNPACPSPRESGPPDTPGIFLEGGDRCVRIPRACARNTL
jgi:hypothetical protein